MDKNNLLLTAINAAIEAGKEICDVYNSADFQVEMKADNSPLTLADKKSHKKIAEMLVPTNLPILSEEGKDIPYNQRKDWDLFWMVDPLDGTKEFIKRNGEFTVNIALIENKLPIAGVIYVPVKKLLYFASQDIGSYKATDISETFSGINQAIEKAEKLPSTFPIGGYVIVASRSHMNEETKKYIEIKAGQCDSYEIISIGSSLKFCLVAEGAAHEYPRFGPTMEWDTAAGHAIVKFAGGKVTLVDSDQELTYNKENLLNPHFIVKNYALQ